VWRAFPGWRCSTAGARRWDDLPREARDYLEWVEREVGVPIRAISVGAARDAEVTRG
jgi:adenylosuccinate synthase